MRELRFFVDLSQETKPVGKGIDENSSNSSKSHSSDRSLKSAGSKETIKSSGSKNEDKV